MTNLETSVTIFTIPKPFKGEKDHISTIQSNAIQSWTLLEPRPQVLVFGNEEGIQDACAELGVTHVPELEANEFGTPLLDGVFQKAHLMAEHPVLIYVNADIILFQDIFQAIERLRVQGFSKYLMIGRRIDTDITARLNFKVPEWSENVCKQALETGKVASVVCRDYFIFPKGLYANIPAFAVGRGHWDSWMVYQAHKLDVPVVDATQGITAVHQNHDYRHLSGTRGKAYVKGGEAQRNAQLAGGMHVIKGADTNWKITQSGVEGKPLSILSIFFDLPRYIKLLTNIFLR